MKKNRNISLQLEQKKLCFKIEVHETIKRKSERRASYRSIIEASKKVSTNLTIKKPDRFGYGNFMTVCVLTNDYRVSCPDGTLDFEATIQNIKSAEKILIESLSSQLVV